MWQNLPLWPSAVSSMAGRVDALMIFLLLVTGSVTVLVFLLIAVFVFRYRSRRHRAERIEGSTPLEIAWSIIPAGIFMVFFAWGAIIYMAAARAPKDSMEIYVVAKQWMWKIQHPEGPLEINTLTVPAGRDIRLTMISQDVIHSFYMPQMRLKADVLPGRYTTLWFHPTRPGRYNLFCAEYCGTQHSGMTGEVVVLEPTAFETWLQGGGAQTSLTATGQKLFQEYGCASCHRTDTQGRGPVLVGVYGKKVLLEDNRTVMADDAYIRESILVPGAKVVYGFKPIMPTFQGILSEEQLLAMMAYLKSLAAPAQSQPVRSVAPTPSTRMQ